MPASISTVQKPSMTQTPITPTAGRAKVKSPSQARGCEPRPTARSSALQWRASRHRGGRPDPRDVAGSFAADALDGSAMAEACLIAGGLETVDTTSPPGRIRGAASAPEIALVVGLDLGRERVRR